MSNTRSTRQILTGIYITIILAVFVWLPMIKLHGYRVWWVDLYYGIFAFGIVGGSISHYRMVRQHQREHQVS